MSNDSIAAKLQELFELYKSGTVTKEEFELLKSELINASSKRAPQRLAEDQEPTKSDLPQSREETPLNKKKEIEEVNSIKIDEKSPDTISKPAEVKNKKNKSLAFYLFVIAIVIIGLSVGLNLFLRSVSVQSVDEVDEVDENSYDNVVFEYEVYDTYTVINAPYLYVRNNPSSESSILFKLRDGDNLAVLESGIGENNSWSKILTKNYKRTGYVHGRYIRKIGSLIASTDVEAAQSDGIEIFLKAFFKEYQNKSTKLSSTIHPEVGFFEIFNINNCLGSKTDSLSFYDINTDLTNLLNRKPNGSRCEGYDEKDGIYYFSISENNLHSYVVGYDESIGFISEKVKIPSKYSSSSEIIHVFLIEKNDVRGEYFFAKISGKWYWICQDFCGCPI